MSSMIFAFASEDVGRSSGRMTDVKCGYSVMTSASGNDALDKGHAIRQSLSKAIQHSIYGGPLVRWPISTVAH